MKTKLARNRGLCNISGFLKCKSRGFKLRHHGASTKPSKVSTIGTGTGVSGIFLCEFAKILTGIQSLNNGDSQRLVADKNMSCPNLLLCGFHFSYNGILELFL